MQRRTTLLYLLLALGLSLGLGTGSALAQALISGKVLDENKEPLSHASVKLFHNNGKILRGTTSDIAGAYRLSNIAAGEYTLEVSFVGYASVKRSLKIKSKEDKHTMPTISLEPDSKMLSELRVLGRAAEIKVKGDTIEYNASSYSVQQGATLSELLKKLPGAEIDEKGNITINGKTIKQITIDGKRFFAGDPTVASKNLPAELIDKVQVLDRDTDAARMAGFSDGDEETIINLSIKPGRKRGIFGTATLGGGTERRYEGNAIVNRFSDDDQWTILAGLNNTNNAGFRDIASDLSQSGLMGAVMGGGRFRGRGFGNSGITTSRLLGGNMIHNFTKDLSAGGNAFLGNTNKLATTDSYQQNILTNGSTTERGHVEERNDKSTLNSTIRLEWKPSTKTEIILTPTFTYGTGTGSYIGRSTTLNDATGQMINQSQTSQHSEQINLRGSMELDMSHRIGERGRTLSASLRAGTNKDDGEGEYLSSLKRIGQADQLRDQRLTNDHSGLNTRARLSWVEPLGRGFSAQLLYQYRYETNNSERKAYNADASGKYTQLDQLYSNEFNSTFQAHRIGLALKKVGKKYDLTAGFNLDPSHLTSHSVAGLQKRDFEQNNLNYSPTLRLRYKPKSGVNLNVDYRGNSFQPSVNQMAPVQDVTNPLVEYIGNPNLKPGYRHNIRTNFNAFFAKSQSAINLFAMAEYVQSDIVSKSTYDLGTGKRSIGYTNVDGNMRMMLGWFYNTPLPGKKFSISTGAMTIYNQQIGFINEEENRSRSLRFMPSLTLSYRYGIFDTRLSGRWVYYTVKNTLPSAPTSQDTHDYSTTWEAHLRLPFGLTLENSLAFSTNRGYAVGFNQDQWLLNAGISYSFLKGKRATIRLSGHDLLNQQRSIARSVSALSISSEETNTLGRYAMLSFIYKFNRFSGNASASDMGSRNGSRGSGMRGMHPPL